MVSTRGHPRDFPEPPVSPSKSTPTTRSRAAAGPRKGSWAHTPSNLTLIWLAVSLPLVIWDTGYVLLRPLSMPGGALHWPIWVPYELYGRVDYVYGWKALNEKNGFTSAQGSLNVVETLMYLYYLYVLYAYGRRSTKQGRGAPRSAGFLSQQRYIDGSMAGVAALVAFSAAIMTVSKTVLYGLNEYFSHFQNVGHNKVIDLLFLWIIPNGAWLVLPSYMIYVTGSEILQGLAIAGGGAMAASSDVALIKAE